jgi:predicted nucleic acid-binding protein
MRSTFVDTFFYLALILEDDQYHERAVAASGARRGRFVTTAWVLTEVADALCEPPQRRLFTELLALLRPDPNTEIVAADEALFDRGVDLYAHRPDKAWSLTDCISFVVMTDRGLTEALTGDHHFEQAGFPALLRQG